MLSKAANKNLLWVILLIFLTIPLFRKIVRPGFYPTHDDIQAMRVLQMDKCVKDLQIPCRWVPDMGFGYGYPQFNYYPPLPYYTMELVHLTGVSILGSVKAGVALGFLLSALAMYLLGNELFGKRGGFLSALFYVYAPYLATDVYNRGALSEFWSLIFLPLIFWSIYKIFNSVKRKYAIFFSLSLAGLLLTHVIVSYFFAPIVFLWVAYLMWTKKDPKKIRSIVIGLVLGLGLSAFFTLPVIFERNLVYIDTLTGGFFDYNAHFVSIRQIFTSTHWGFGSTELGPYDDFTFSLGIIHLAAVIVSLVLAFLCRKTEKSVFKLLLFFVLISLGSLFLTHQKSVFLWRILPGFSFIQFPWRFLVVAAFSIAVLAGAMMHLVKDKYSKNIILIVFTIMLILLNLNYFRPREWIDINDVQKFSGVNWEKQLTISIYDYLPIVAQKAPDEKAPQSPIFESNQSIVLTGETGTDWQKWQVEIKEDGESVMLPVYDFPKWKVRVDGKEVMHQHNNELGLVEFKLNGGVHAIEAKLTDTPVRTIGNLLTILSVGTIIYYLGVKKNA